MIAGLERFVAELRREGLAASPAEWLDALRALERVGVADRERFRVALRATLVKRSAQRAVFDAAFERFFVAPARGSSRKRGSASGAEEATGKRRREPVPEARSTPPRGRPDPAREPARIRSCSESTHPLRLRRLLERAREGGPERRSRLRRVVVEERGERREERVARLHRPSPRPDASRRDLHGRLSLEEEREIAAQLPRFVEQIRLRSGRRLVRARRGRPYLREVFRENLSHDGVPFVIPRRRIRPRRSRVILLVDVSWSVARAAGLFLSMALEFLRVERQTRILLFVDRPIEATERVAHWMRRTGERGASGSGSRGVGPGSGIVRGGLSFARLLESVPALNLSAASDYGRTFDSLLRSRRRPLGRDTLLLVLGDGRTNRFDSQAWAFEELTARSGAAIWLVPEAIEQWGSGDSALADYLPHVDVAVEARDLAGLAGGVRELIRRL